MITPFFDCSELHVRFEDIGEHIERQKQVLREATAKHQVSHYTCMYVHEKRNAFHFQIIDFSHMAKPSTWSHNFAVHSCTHVKAIIFENEKGIDTSL